MIKDNVQRILKEIPEGVELIAVVKGRPLEKVLEAVDSGIKTLGINYVKDANRLYPVLERRVIWHYIGIARLEKHDLLRRKYLEIFDMIETVDSVELTQDIDRRCSQIGKIMPILIEVNIAGETQKSGIMPEDVESLIMRVSKFSNIKVMGLMTMGPLVENPEELRPYFRKVKEIFDYIRGLEIPNIEMRYLSMGMSDSYRIAIEEGANIVRIGTKLFEE